MHSQSYAPEQGPLHSAALMAALPCSRSPARRLPRMASSSALSSMAGTQMEVKRLERAGDSSFLP